MSTIKSSNEHLTLNADGSSKDIKFQANGVEKASISSAGAFTSTTIDATKLTGNLPAISGAALTGVGVAGITSTADATAITISSAEKVGIGETSPTTHLLCLGEDSGSGDNAASSGISFRASSTENYMSIGSVGGANNTARGLVIKREGTQKLKITGDGGICFGTDTAAANALDDYEEGTWTPTLTIGGTVGYSTREGSYTKVGNLVNINFAISINSISSLSSTVGISGFPFTSASSSAGDNSPVQFGLIRSLATDYPNIRGYVAAGNTLCSLTVQATNAGHTGLPGTAITTSSLIYGSATYRTA